MTRHAFIHQAETQPRECPACHRVLTAATGVSTAETRPTIGIGDVSCCAYCGAVLVVTTLGFRLASDADLARLAPLARQILFEMSNECLKSRGRWR